MLSSKSPIVASSISVLFLLISTCLLKLAISVDVKAKSFNTELLPEPGPPAISTATLLSLNFDLTLFINSTGVSP